MGRNKATSVKPRNSNPVFKLAGGKAGKAKGKTQEVTSRLKHVSLDYMFCKTKTRNENRMKLINFKQFSFSSLF